MQKRIGEFLVEKGLINAAQRQEILNYSSKSGLRFGDAGLALGYYSREQLTHIFGVSGENEFFYLDPAYFPQTTRHLLHPDEILRLGAIPLGFKREQKLFSSRKLLNLGMLDPSRREVLGEVGKIAGEKGIELQGIKVFLVLADQFLGVLRQIYGIGDERLETIPSSALDPVLSMYLEPPVRPNVRNEE